MTIQLRELVEHVIKKKFDYPTSVAIVDCGTPITTQSSWVHLAFDMNRQENINRIQDLADKIKEVTECVYGKPVQVRAYIEMENL